MRSDLTDLLRGSGSLTESRNRLREFLQARLLSSLQRAGAMIPLAFQGGTALRFLYSIPRYSEDLDFALERPDRGYDFRTYLTRIQGDLRQEGFAVEVKANDQKVVHNAFGRRRLMRCPPELSGCRLISGSSQNNQLTGVMRVPEKSSLPILLAGA